MKLNLQSKRHLRTAKFLAITLAVLPLPLLGAPSVSASGASPSGINIGLDFIWNSQNSPNGITASFIENDGVSLNNCGASTATTKGCHFVFEYSIGSFTQPAITHSDNYLTWTNPTSYSTDPRGVSTPDDGGCSPSNNQGPAIPLTLNDCFNANSFGQIFFAGATGELSSFKMSMTCLQPAGQKIELYALLYELNDPATSIKGTAPLGSTKLDLSTCPTATTWQGKTFTANDFAMIPFNFRDVSLTQGVPYGVFFAGSSVPGAAPVGATEAVAAASGTTEDLLQDELPGELKLLTTVRLLKKGDKTKTLLSRTPATCLVVGERVLAIAEGECRIQVRSATNSVSSQASRGKVLSTFTSSIKTDGTQAGLTVSKKRTVRFNRYSTAPQRVSSALIKDARAAKGIVLVGHTAIFTGNSSENSKLSAARANAVRAELVSKKVKRSLISMTGVAARQPVNMKRVEKDQQQNRRVDVYILM